MDKSLIKSILFKYEVRVVSSIVSDVTNRASKRDTLRRVRKEILRLKLDTLETNEMWKFATTFYKHTVAAAGPRKTFDDPELMQKELQKRADKVYTVLRQDTQMLEHQKNVIADSIEFRFKNQRMHRLMTPGDEAGKFLYCTAHKDPACGHAAYQGRIYFKRSETYSEEEQEFISRKGLLAAEDVIMGPIWLTTRRNCKHQFIPISFLQAQTGRFSVGNIKDDISYEEEQYRFYSDRLKMMASVKKVFAETDVVPEQLKWDMTRTYRLCRAWSRRIKKSRS